MGRNICRWLCPILIVVILIISWRCPWWRGPIRVDPVLPGSGAAAESAPNLVIDHVDAAAWAPVNNSFHEVPGADEDSTYFRTGFVAQLGNFPDTKYGLEGVTLLDASGAVVWTSALADGDPFYWINVSGLWPGQPVTPTPISAQEAFWLFPNGTVADGCGGSEDVTNPGEVPIPCRRGRQIHPDMERVRAVVSYWQGPQGFDVRSTQPYGADNDKRFEFRFRDGFRVEVWKLDTKGDADAANDAFVRTDVPDTVTRIVVEAKQRSGPTGGATQEPPWWYP